MRVFYSSGSARGFCKKGSLIAIGNYDGVHLGHRAILETLVQAASKANLPSVVYTFKPHPVLLLAPSVAPKLLNTLSQKIELLKSCGVGAVILEKFTPAFAHHAPDDFFRKFLMNRLKSKKIFVGYDFTFGAKRQGNIETLEQLGKQDDVDVCIIPPFMKGDTLVSSSLIRKQVMEGKMKEATLLLNRPYFLEGKVVRGTQRGRTLGIPTANLLPDNELIPKDGVYATRVQIRNQLYWAVTNIGNNPTFGGTSQNVETHFFNLKKNLYNKKIRIYFIDRLRDEKQFENPTQLKIQIDQDIRQAKKILAK